MGRKQIYAIVALFAVVGVIAGVATFSGASSAKTTLYSHKNFHSTIIRDLFS
jgi:fluoride ion exporter CrcB/FEX